MKSTLAKLAMIALPLFGTVGTAHALSQNTVSNKFFDENGVLVGQQILLCNALAYHAGNIHTAYTITESVACSKNPPLDYIVPGTIITAYTLPGALSISSACGQAECAPAGAPEPLRITDKGWTWQNFWQ
ncbi:hypothetical protein KK141_06630 [Dyella sp. LX-66]|uniref:hypothetical protein n=1 Tax=unclassified Dyella TaxID=2634549 RepID=UPI001BE06246|nr:MULTISPECIES: hypothetical protein [unclassified Dyella]MBT2116619.1 hypothetical protein [Dyella sp. LX-1]MBT2139201.1 hypothetical protein [Dyella sp. LX-66]